jgi:hypothetical protein
MDKPDKIWITEETNCSGRYWTNSFRSAKGPYFHADLLQDPEFLAERGLIKVETLEERKAKIARHDFKAYVDEKHSPFPSPTIGTCKSCGQPMGIAPHYCFQESQDNE